MKEKYITYKLGDRTFNVPESQSQQIESRYPDLTIEMKMGDRVFDVPLSDKSSILNKYGSRLNYAFDEEDSKNMMTDSQPSFAPAEDNESATLGNHAPRKSWINRVTEKAQSLVGHDDLKEDDIYSTILNSVSENREKVTNYLNTKQEEYKAKPRKELKWYEKIGASPSVSTMHSHGLGGAVYNQFKKEVSEMGPSVQDALIADGIYRGTQDKIDQYLSPAKNYVSGVLQGLGDSVFNIETWDSTIGAERAARIYTISKKSEKGEALTEGEQMIVDALVDDLAVDIYMASEFGRGYKAGKVTGESIPFMIETIFNPASGAGKAVTQKFGKAIFKKVYQKLGSMAAKTAVGATRVATDIAGAAAMSATTSQSKVVEDAFNRLSGQVSFDVNENGILDFNGFVGGEDSAFQAYAKAYGANAIEHFSEMVGNYFAPIGKMTRKGVGHLADKIGLSKINELLNEMTPNGFGSLVNDFTEQTQWHGIISEFAEEEISGAMNALIVGDQTLKKYDENGNINSNYLFDKDNLIDTFLGVSILGGVMSAAKTIGYTTPNVKYNREISKAKKGLDGHISEREMEMLEAFALNPMGADYANIEPFFDESRSKESKEAVAKYLSAVMQKQGYNIAREADLSGTQQGMNEMRNAWKLGQNMTEADLYDVNEAEEQAKQSLIDTGVFDAVEGSTDSFLPQDVLGYSSYDLYNLSERSDWDFTEEQRAAIKNLAIARNAREGLYNKLDSITESAITTYNTIANNASSNGTITIGLYNGQKVYIKGDVTVSNGVIEKPSETSGYPVEIVDANTGEASTIDSSELSDVFNGSIDEYNAVMSNVITNEFQQRYDSWKNTKSAKSKLAEIQQYVGEKVFIQTANNDMAEVEIQQILPNGEVLIKGKKGDLGGQSNIRVDVDSFYDSMSRDANGNPIFNQAKFNSQTQRITEAQKRMNGQEPSSSPSDIEQNNVSPINADYRGQTVTVLINGVPTEVYVTSQDNASDSIVYEFTAENGRKRSRSSSIGEFVQSIKDAEQHVPEQPNVPEATTVAETPEQTVEVAPTEVVATETPVEAPAGNVTLDPESINWEDLFNRDQEAYFVELQRQFGEESADVLNEEIEAVQGELDALSKAKTTNQNERIANRGKKKALQAKLDSLNGMAKSLAASTDIVQEASSIPVAEANTSETPVVSTDASSSIPAVGMPEPVVVPIEKDQEPRNAIEFAARELGLKNGGIKLLVDSFKHHTGFGNTEVRKFFGLFRTKDKGGMTLEEAGERLMELDRENNTGFFDQNDPNAGLNAILDAIGFNSTMGELRSFTARMVQEEAQREADAVYAYEMEQYEKALDKSHRDDVFAEELMAGKAYTEDEYNELMTILAEEINDYDTGNQRENDILHEEEDIGYLPASKGEAYGGIEGSNQILQEAQPVQTSGERDSQRRGANQGIVGEDASSPVHNGESSDNERGSSEEGFVSSLGEDIPDFTQESERIPVAPKQVENPYDASKDREGRLLELVQRQSVDKAFKRDKAYEAGKDVGDFFATYEEYEDYQAVATDFGEYNNDFERGVKASFANRSQYQIGHGIEKNPDISDEAIDLTNDVIDMLLAGANIDVERASDEQTQEVLALGGIENQFSVETDKPIFISNAALAVHGIKQEKATPEQWINMITKAGGIKTGEDKWVGLSDWLKASDKKTLTKQEVLDYIHENEIQIEEEHYSESAEDNATIVYGQMRDILQGEFNHYRAEYYEEHEDDDFYGNPAADYAIEKLRNYFGDTQFPYDIEVDNSGDVYFTFYHEDDTEMEKWAEKLGVKYEPQNPINSTRLMYTSDGLENKKEIALIVPTIKSWGEWDDVHFGDAGKGKAIAWVRFGDTEVIEETEESKDFASALRELANDARQKYGKKRSAWPNDVRAAYDMLLESELGSMRNRKILVIDEIQSKRHQEGRDKGYSMSIEEYEQRLNALENERAERLKRRTILLRQLTEKYGDDFNSYLKLQDTAYIPNENVMTPEEVQEWYATTQDEIDSAIYNLKKEMHTGIPAAPFEKNWPELAMKRMLRYAAENGYDAVAWTRGAQQAERYNISKSVENIDAEDNIIEEFEDGTPVAKSIHLDLASGESIPLRVDADGNVRGGRFHGNNLSDIIGKELAVKVMQPGNIRLSGEGLRVGGEGMKGFYDKMLPAFMNKYGKKWGISVSEIELPMVEADEGYTFHSVPVTQAMKDSVMEGQPMFFKTPNGIVYGWTDGKKIYLTKAGMNPNTKIHEYTHLWAKAMMQKNPKGWNSIKQLIKKTPVWKQVMNDANYSNIHGNEDMVASEVLSRISGTNNAAKLEQMAQQMIDEAKGTMRKAEARGLIQNIKDALNKFWSWVGKNLFEIENFNSIGEITDRVLWDLVNKTGLQLDTLEDSKLELSKQKKSPSVVAPTNAGYATVTPSDCAANINQLKQIYNSRNITRTEGFITNVAKNMGLTPDGPSHYRTFKTPLGEVTFRISNHNAVVSNFDERGEDKAISIVITANRNRKVKNDGNAVVKEFFYTKQGLERSTDKPLVKILDSIEDFLKTGKYIDKTGIAYPEDVNGILYRRDNVQNAAIEYLAGNARAAAIEHAVNKESSKLGVAVTYKTRSEMPKGHENDKGYYNTKTGEIVICTENNADINDAIQTILHETVAHKGLRQLMGDRFDEFISRVYNSLDAETKAKVDALAAEQYGGNTSVAMEEYMASLAETEDFANTSVWEKIKDIFNNIINSILGRNDIKIGDNELRYILRASYNNMVNPNTMETIEGWAKDTNMRNELGINEATPEILSRTGIDDIAFTTAREAYEIVTFNGFTEIMKSIQNATGFKGKIKAIKTGLLKIWNEYQMENQDAQQAVITGIEAIQKENGNIPIEDFENYLMAENQSQSRSAEEIESFLNNQFAAIVDQINDIITSVMKARGMKFKNKKQRAAVYNEVRQYLIAKHGLERNKYYQNSTGKMRDYSGLTALFGLPDTEFALAETMAQDMVDKFEAEIGDAARDDLWKKINAATRKTLRHAYESGLLSRAQHDKIRDMFDFYIPLRGFDETTAEDVYNYASYDGNRFQPAVRDAHGRTSLAFDPISVIMNMAQSEIIQGNKNRVKQALYHFIGNRPNSLLTPRECWYVLDKATGAFVEAYPDIANGETWEQFEIRMQALEATGDAMKQKKGLDVGYRFQKPANKNEHYIHLKINGVEHAIYVNGNQRLAEGVNGFNKQTHSIIDGVKKANRAASQLFTSYSYKFGGKNFLRDFVWAQTVMLIKESPVYNLRFAANWAINNPITIGVLMKKYRNGTLDMNNENHRLFKEFVENGGKTGYVFIDKLEKQKHKIDKAVERMSKIGNTKTNSLTKAAVLFNIIQYANECIELAARFGTYVTSRNTKDKSGNVRSIAKSIDDAKEITTNFNRKGAQSGRGLIGGLANFMGSWNFFYNPGVQGVQQIKSLNNEHPIKTKVVFGGWIGLGFVIPFILDIFRGDDDDEDEIYWNIPEYERKNNLCIPFGKGKLTMTIPLSPTIREAYAIGVTISDAMFNKSVDKDATMLSMECASLLAKAFIPANPVEGLSVGLTPAENLIMFGTPDIADPIVEAVINKDWKGAPIEYRTSYNEGAPHYTKVIGKNNWKKSIGEKLYKLGENNLESSTDWNLSAWEHVFSSGLGGIGAIIKDISNVVEWVANTETPERLNDIPVVRTLFSSSAMDDEKFVNDIYWDMDEVYKKKTKTLSSVYGLTEKEAFVEQEGFGESNLVKVYEAKSYPFLQKFYELNKELSSMQKDINKMPTETDVDKAEKALAEQELFNKKRDMVYELLEYEIE